MVKLNQIVKKFCVTTVAPLFFFNILRSVWKLIHARTKLIFLCMLDVLPLRIYTLFSPDIYYHRWSKEPLTQGAFSDPVVGMTSKDWENIGKNLGRLYFAGEATSEEWYGYMQGAYLTGDKKGKMIAENIFLHEPISKPGKPKSEATLVKVPIPGVFLLSYLHSLLWN